MTASDLTQPAKTGAATRNQEKRPEPSATFTPTGRSYPYNCWVAALWKDAGEGLLSRRVLEMQGLLYRCASGQVVALEDRCPQAVEFLVKQRNVLGFGTESISTDAGQGRSMDPPDPCHSMMHGAGRHGLQCLTNLDQFPSSGALIVCPPLKIKNGGGSPVCVLALHEKN